VKIIYAPNDDNSLIPLSREDLSVALRAAREVADGLAAGRKTLVTCWMGWNRSGLVSALSLHFLLGCSGQTAYKIVREARKNALGNEHFRAALFRLQRRRKV
jgi:protein-tyrosine phosphatase